MYYYRKVVVVVVKRRVQKNHMDSRQKLNLTLGHLPSFVLIIQTMMKTEKKGPYPYISYLCKCTRYICYSEPPLPSLPLLILLATIITPTNHVHFISNAFGILQTTCIQRGEKSLN